MGPATDPTDSTHYQTAMAEVTKQLQRPTIQRSMFSMARTSPRDIVRSNLSSREISHRTLSYLPDELLSNIPESDNSYSLFQGFQATIPDVEDDGGKKHRRRVSRGRKLLEDSDSHGLDGASRLQKLKKDKATMTRDLDMMGVRKNMASSEIRDIDNKIANLHGMRRILLDRLATLEQDETLLEHDGRLIIPCEVHGLMIVQLWKWTIG